MLVIEIDNFEYSGPQLWEDVTIKKYLESVELLKKMPKKLYDLTFGNEDDKSKIEIIEEDVIDFGNFYKTWVAFWFDLPLDIAGKLPIEVKEEETEHLGIVNLYRMLQRFMVMPSEDELKPLNSFYFKGLKYMIPETHVDINGNETPMNKASFDEFYESVELKRVEKDLKDGKATILPLLTAILCRPATKITKGYFWNRKTEYVIEAYDSSKVRERAKLFESLTMDKAWGAYFFFIQSKNTLLKNTLTSLKKQAKENQLLPQMLFGLAGI